LLLDWTPWLRHAQLLERHRHNRWRQHDVSLRKKN
jgi:hypothetical protein